MSEMRVESGRTQRSTPADNKPAEKVEKSPQSNERNEVSFKDGFDKPSGKGAVALSAKAARAEPPDGGEAPPTSEERIHNSSAYKAMSDGDKKKVDHVAAQASEKGKAALANMLETNPSRLFDKDKDGKTTLDNLDKLATQELNAGLKNEKGGYTKQQIVDSVLDDVANPGQIDQGSFNTCQVTDIQWEMASRNPSEYARLMAGLTGPEGKAQMRGGDTLDLHKDYLSPNPGDNRSASEALFQTAVMQEITGTYEPRKDQNTSYWVIHHPGNSTWDSPRTMEQLFGPHYDAYGVSKAGVAWDAKARMDKDQALNFLNQADPSKGPVIADLCLEGMSVSHSVSITKIENGRVYFRNPWGPGQPANNSGKVEDPANSIYSMSVDEFAGRMQMYLQPGTAPDTTPGTPTP